MVSSTRQAIAGLLVIFAVAVLAHAQTTPVKEPTATVSGRITIKDKPAPGIAVGLRVNEPPRQQPVSYRAVTDVNGEYRITNVPAGNYWMNVSAPAFVLTDDTANSKSLIIGKGEMIENVDFTLLRGGVITGKVTDASFLKPSARIILHTFRPMTAASTALSAYPRVCTKSRPAALTTTRLAHAITRPTTAAPIIQTFWMRRRQNSSR
jgi:hypothetical protein